MQNKRGGLFACGVWSTRASQSGQLRFCHSVLGDGWPYGPTSASTSRFYLTHHKQTEPRPALAAISPVDGKIIPTCPSGCEGTSYGAYDNTLR